MLNYLVLTIIRHIGATFLGGAQKTIKIHGTQSIWITYIHAVGAVEVIAWKILIN